MVVFTHKILRRQPLSTDEDYITTQSLLGFSYSCFGSFTLSKSGGSIG